MKVKAVSLNALLCVGAIFLASCAATPTTTTPHMSGSIVTSGESLSKGKRVPVQSFTLQDYVVYLVDFQWEAAAEKSGSHVVEWRWYQNDKLVSQTTKTLAFSTTPYSTRSQRAASALGVGHFKVEALLDGAVAASNNFDIAP